MTLTPTWRNRLSAIGAASVAIWLGFAVAQEELAWPAIGAGVLVGLMLARLQPIPLATLLLGGVICGYILGNRGFAQFSLSARLPLLPAEFVLLVAGCVLLIQHAWRRELPIPRDALNWALVAWVLVGLTRVVMDVREYGAMALRDFAVVYYAAFFLLGQFAANHSLAPRFLHACFAGSCVLLLILQPLFSQFPEFFLSTLTVRGIPLIYYKGDLSATFMAAGAVVYFLAYERTSRAYLLGISFALTAGCLATNNRASLLGLIVISLLLGLARRWRFAVFQAVAALAAAVVILFAAHVTHKSWKQTPLYGVYERAASFVDPLGERSYSGEDTFYKGDNNRFRSVWWAAVFNETKENSPWLGLGFGYDLAARFVSEYYADSGDEFSARSPHNVVLTVFARMGLAGLLPFVVAIAIIGWRCHRSARSGPTLETAFWAAGVIIFVSACFGVVLEGPMGAVIFWTVLGVANGLRANRNILSTTAPTAAASLPSDAPADEVPSAS